MSSNSRNNQLSADVAGEFIPMRLQKFLARAGVDSRRHCEQVILDGRVTVNGQVVDGLGSKVDPNVDVVAVDGRVVSLGEAPVTIMMNKPAGYLTTMDDPQGRKCVAQLEPFGRYPGLFPVGRLDMDTTGLLVITNDGALGYKLAHPKHHVEKTYVAQVSGKVGDAELEQLRQGVMIHDGMTAPAEARILRQNKRGSVLEIIIHEGRNRQVRRMCQAVGHPVLKLERVAMGPLKLGNLEPGAWRILEPEELSALRCASDGS